MQTPLEEIKEKIDIVDFIRSYITLHPAGKNFKALCPFHQEKTPSLIISPDKQIWHCFGCQKGGDVIKFLMLYENLEFYEALRVLAEKAGVELKRLNLQDQKEFNTLYELNEKAKNFYKEQLVKSPASLEYLKKRALRQNTIEEFEIGFAPAGGENLVLYLINLGYNINDIAKAGLAIKTERGKYLDRFYNRIMFPIYNNFGKVIGFSGRILPQFENPEIGKYVNSPETPLFNKSRVLYGFHKAKAEIGHSQTAFLVEGQMDFLMTWQSGIKNVVATSGTALSQDQLKNLRRLADSLVVSFDKDEAGIKAMERGLEFFGNLDFNVKVLDLNGYKDPAEAAEKDPGYLKTALEKTQPAFVCLSDFYLKNEPNWTVKKRNIQHLLRLIKGINSSIEQANWLKELSLKSGIEEKILVYELATIKIKPPTSADAEEIENKEAAKLSRLDLLCQKIFSLILFRPEFLPVFAKNRDYFPITWQKKLDNPSLIKIIQGGPPTLPEQADGEGNESFSLLELRSSYEFSDLDEPALKKESEDLTKHLKIEFLQNQNNQLNKEIDLAEKNKNSNLVNKLSVKFTANSQEINNLKNNK
ncbi:MAG: DNA primase [Candidatus Paceibacterota bacterium]